MSGGGAKVEPTHHKSDSESGPAGVDPYNTDNRPPSSFKRRTSSASILPIPNPPSPATTVGPSSLDLGLDFNIGLNENTFRRQFTTSLLEAEKIAYRSGHRSLQRDLNPPIKITNLIKLPVVETIKTYTRQKLLADLIAGILLVQSLCLAAFILI